MAVSLEGSLLRVVLGSICRFATACTTMVVSVGGVVVGLGWPGATVVGGEKTLLVPFVAAWCPVLEVFLFALFVVLPTVVDIAVISLGLGDSIVSVSARW